MLRVCRLGVLLLLVVLGASPAPVSGSVESAGDAVTHTASSGTTKLSLNSDQGHQIQVGGTNVAVVDSSGMAVTGTFTYTAKPYVAGHKLSADLSLSNTVWTDLVWSSSASDVVANGAMSWSSNKIFTPTNSGLYKVTVSVCARLEAGATAGANPMGGGANPMARNGGLESPKAAAAEAPAAAASKGTRLKRMSSAMSKGFFRSVQKVRRAKQPR